MNRTLPHFLYALIEAVIVFPWLLLASLGTIALGILMELLHFSCDGNFRNLLSFVRYEGWDALQFPFTALYDHIIGHHDSFVAAVYQSPVTSHFQPGPLVLAACVDFVVVHWLL